MSQEKELLEQAVKNEHSLICQNNKTLVTNCVCWKNAVKNILNKKQVQISTPLIVSVQNNTVTAKSKLRPEKRLKTHYEALPCLKNKKLRLKSNVFTSVTCVHCLKKNSSV